jgi:toxin-antitoxin system PIN domain toxin
VSRAALLDVNVLVALFDPEHVHHETAHDWFSDYQTHGWATCPVTEAGFLRILANPRYGGVPVRAADLLGHLKKFRASGHHEFWTESLSLCDEKLFDLRFAAGHRQITDIYLLGLARSRGASLVTFDQTIPLKAVVGAKPQNLSVLSAIEPH